MPAVFAIAVAALLMLSDIGAAADPVRSGLQPGEHVTTVFEPVNLNGPNAEEPHCLVCENGLNPVAMVVARDWSAPLGKLVTKLDAACMKHEKQELGSFVVFLDASDSLQATLRKVAAGDAFKKLVLALESESAIPEYKASVDAEVTVMLYVRHDVKANFAFRKGELDDAAIERVIAALPKILGEK